MFVKKWPSEYQKVIKSYLPTYLWDNSDSSDNSYIINSRDSSDSSASSDSSDSSVSSERSDAKIFFLQKLKRRKNTKQKIFHTKKTQTPIVMKLKSPIVIKLKKNTIVMKL